MHEDDIKWERLARYFAAECSPEELSRLEAWIGADAELQKLVNQLRPIWEASALRPDGFPLDGKADLEADFEELVRKIHATPRRALASDRPPAPSRYGGLPIGQRAFSFGRSASSFRRLVGMAVLLVLLVGGGLFAVKLTGGLSPAESPLREIITGRGERATVRLADGTEVILNVDSQLRLSETFGQGEVRAVYLQGEAYFDVAPNAERPFIVHAGQAVVLVKGTAFNVDAYPEGHEVEVAVAEGTVVLTSEEKAPAIRLKPGQLGRLLGDGSRVMKEQADVQTYLGWIEGRLVFEDTPLSEVAVRLERWYDVEFKIQGDVPPALRLTALLNSRSIHDVLDVITVSLGLQYRIEGNTVFLMGKE